MDDQERLAEVKALHFIGQISNADVDWLVGKVERLRELLGRLEHACDVDACPVCIGLKPDHEPDCWLAKELGR
jgi:hypothetical protein